MSLVVYPLGRAPSQVSRGQGPVIAVALQMGRLASTVLIESLRRQRRQAEEVAQSQAISLTREQAARAEAEAANRRLAEEQRAALALAEELKAVKEKLARDNEELQRRRDAQQQLAPELEHGLAKTTLLEGSQPAERHRDLPPASGQTLERLPIRGTYSVMLLRVAELDFVESRNRRVFVRANGVEHPTNYTLARLEAMLPPADFLRIHDSCIVNLDRIVDLLLLGSHNYEVRLTDGHRLPVGRTRYPELRRRLGLEDQIGP